jgi:hypothetical protein
MALLGLLLVIAKILAIFLTYVVVGNIHAKLAKGAFTEEEWHNPDLHASIRKTMIFVRWAWPIMMLYDLVQIIIDIKNN